MGSFLINTDCYFQIKYRKNIFTHLSYKHDLGVKWHYCPHCEYKAKTNGSIKSHLTHKHKD